MENIYKTGKYLEETQSWHVEDSPWKADQIIEIIQKNSIRPKIVAELGCGAGAILEELSKKEYLAGTQFKGYDISQDAVDLCAQHTAENIIFSCQDLLADNNHDIFDLLLVIDVFEHVPNYFEFLEKCKNKAEYIIYHIPLEIHVSSVLRNTLCSARYTLGHLHYYTADSAIGALKDTGHEIIDFSYTNGALGLYKHHPSFKRAIANVPRWILSKFSVPLASRLLGGYSLLVLTKRKA